MSKRRSGRHLVPPRPGAMLLRGAGKVLAWLASTTGAGIIGAIVSPFITPLVGAWFGFGGN